MALNTYLTLTAALLQAPSSPVPLVSDATLTEYINIARLQVAGDGECIRAAGVLPLTAHTQTYSFNLITTGTTGVGSILAIRSARLGASQIDIRPFEWFQRYYAGVMSTGTPVRMAQLGQGADGEVYVDPIPDTNTSFGLDVVALPDALASDSDPEAIPYPWTDAIPYYAAWIAMMSLQRQTDANTMRARYEDLMRRARQYSTPSELPDYLPGGAGSGIASTHLPLGSRGAPEGRR